MQITFTLDRLNKIAHDVFLPLLKTHTIFAFVGPLGVGKTTLIKEIFKQCGVAEVVNSPTFGYVKSYKVSGITYNHFDLYRLDSLDAFINAGFDEYLYAQDTLNFIEWPEILDPLLQKSVLCEKVCYITISYCSGFSGNKVKRVIRF